MTAKLTPFQKAVYDAISRVPRGMVTTYGAVARELGRGCPAAVGQALKRNPFAPKAPCHRVIASDLSIGGFRGRRGGKAIAEKLDLLESEGVRFRNGKLVDCGKICSFH
ncbi:MAG: MGMT family protein [Kiritimatiellia bacterium]